MAQRPKQQRPNRPRRNRNGRGDLGNPSNKLIPAGVNNRATMPDASFQYTLRGEEVIRIINAPAVADPGTVLANELVSVASARRLNLLSQAFQRVKWHKAELHLVALNGSIATSGYNAGFAEDPELSVPANPSDVIPFLTSMRTTAVRQNWVESSTGKILRLSELPEMFTTLGVDPRRFYIGRFLAAYTGNPGANVTFQLLLKYHVTLSVPIAKAATDDSETYTLTQDLRVGSCGLANTAGSPTGVHILTNNLAPVPVTSLAPLPPPGIWELDNDSGGFFRLAGLTQTLTSEDEVWKMHDAVKDASFFDEIHQIFVPLQATSWTEVTYRTSTGTFKPWPNGSIFGRRRAESPPISFETIDFTMTNDAFLPNFAATPPWFGAVDFPSLMPGNWPQQPILKAGSILRKVITSNLTLEERINELQQRVNCLSTQRSG
jgi:hypothetical protein